MNLATVRRHLSDLPDAYAHLTLVLLPGSQPGQTRHRRTNPAETAPVRVDVLDLLDTRRKESEPGYHGERLGVLPELESWVRLFDADLCDAGVYHIPPAENPTITTETGWLLLHLEQIKHHAAFREFAKDVRTMHRQVTAALGERPDYHPRCPTCGWRFDRIETPSPDGIAMYYRCRGCGHTIDHHAEMRRIMALQPPATLREIANLIDIPAQTLRRWERAGLLTATGRRGNAKTYELDHVRSVAAGLRNPKPANLPRHA